MSEHDFPPHPFFASAGFEVVEIGADQVPELQRFYDANPAYFLTVHGEVAGPDEAHETVFEPLPGGWPFTKLWVLGVVAESGGYRAMLHVVSDLLAVGVWHIGLFIVATGNHGDGTARALLRCLEQWAISNGATWLRLGVVVGNLRGERFWESCGFVESRRRARAWSWDARSIPSAPWRSRSSAARCPTIWPWCRATILDRHEPRATDRRGSLGPRHSMISRQYLLDVRIKRTDIPSFDAYPFSLPAVRHLDVLRLHPKVTFLVGENGTGKSTLLEAIAVACGFNAEGGTKNFNFGTRASHSPLHAFIRIAKGVRSPKDGFFLRAESFFNVATEIERLDVGDSYGGRSLHEQSHGESFLALMMNRFGGQGLYLLDEPEAALSPQRQLAALSRIHDLVLDDSQFIIATHSPILMAYPDACIYACTAEGLAPMAYEDTEHFQVTRDFLANPARMLRVLMER